MPDDQPDRAPATTQPAAYCTTTPVTGTYLTPVTLTAPCPDCGHATVLHIGVDHCPVCELVGLNQQARDGVPVRMTANLVGKRSIADEAWAQAFARHAPVAQYKG